LEEGGSVGNVGFNDVRIWDVIMCELAERLIE